VTGKVLLDTNVFIDYLRAGQHEEWVWGGPEARVRFLSAIVLLELRLGADTQRRRRAVDRIQAAFPPGRVLTPTPELFDRAGRLFRLLYGGGRGRVDRLAPIDDLLIALTARQAGATLVTSNLVEFQRIATSLPGLFVVSPSHRAP
jgi:predicted nucleic acid-binding protein